MNTKDIVYISLFAALVAVLGLIPAIMLPTGIPITAQSLGVMLAGTILGAKRGGLAVLLFIVLVALGLPLLSGGRGGLGVFVSPTAGFVVGFPIAALATGYLMERLPIEKIGIAAGIAAVIGGIFVLYICGIVGFSIVMGKSIWVSTLAMSPYIPGDFLKALVAGSLTQAIFAARPQSVLSKQ
jgi:biotin transport system substrate-specific component